MTKITEQSSLYRHLEKMSVSELTANINTEDKKVALAIESALPQINRMIEEILKRLEQGGRLFYLGAGSGGRLSVLDAIELPTTYGIPKGVVNVILAGGVAHLVEAREEEEDNREAGWKALEDRTVSEKDFVLGISASGTTPFVLAALQACQLKGITTGCLVSNPESPIAGAADFPLEIITGPEFVSGSTRMKCGTMQKMVFDMISTTCMVRLRRVEDNKMVNVQLINDKITDRAVKMLMERAGLTDYDKAKTLLLEKGSVKKALEALSE